MQPPSQGSSFPASRKARIMSNVPESTHWRLSITISTIWERKDGGGRRKWENDAGDEE